MLAPSYPFADRALKRIGYLALGESRERHYWLDPNRMIVAEGRDINWRGEIPCVEILFEESRIALGLALHGILQLRHPHWSDEHCCTSARRWVEILSAAPRGTL